MSSEDIEFKAREFLIKGLQTDWSNYLDDLELLAESDRVLAHDKECLRGAFANAKEYCISNRSGELASWEIFNLDYQLQQRLMHIVIRLQTLYPSKYETTSNQIESYEDDFEYEEEFEEEFNSSKFSVIEEPLSLGHELEDLVDEDINNKVSSRSSSLKSYSDGTFEMPSIQYSYYDEYDHESSTDSRKDNNTTTAAAKVSINVSINSSNNINSNNNNNNDNINKNKPPGTNSSDSISPKNNT